MAEIAIVGGGSLGLLLAARLRSSGCDAELWTRTPAQASAVTADGITVIDDTAREAAAGTAAQDDTERRAVGSDGSGSPLLPPPEWSAQQTLRSSPVVAGVPALPLEAVRPGSCRMLIVAVKQPALNGPLLRRLSEVVRPDGFVAMFQNGIGSRGALERALPGRGLAVAVTTEAALRTGEATVRHTGHGTTWLGDTRSELVWLGETGASNDTRGETDGIVARAGPEAVDGSADLNRLSSWLDQAGFSVIVSNHLEERILGKLLINAVINPLTATLRVRNGELPSTPERVRLMKALFDETFETLACCGLAGKERLWDALLNVCASTAGNESSMLRDVELHKETEIEYINGAVCRIAARYGQPAPWNEAVASIVRATRRAGES